ncbi:MAG: 2-oxo acid dehydrogenase subunit E2 [Deltaproteobacteria bacterium]|nr:2-oxo acid dehydrogenase subunit E2 [Deltaproteobacteria bacterium]RLB48912.1 MAG: 2-oxo acid dehydrogenase subunit E2 [Deltaproteobacteria bacterium]
MARLDFKLPDIGEGVAEGEIVEWFVGAGDTVREDDPMVEVMTDKATVTIGAPFDARVERVCFEVGAVARVGQVILTLESDASSNVGAAQRSSRPPASAVGDIQDRVPGAGLFEVKPLATPAIRRLAKDMGVDIRRVRPTGEGGRVTRDDVRGSLREEMTEDPRHALLEERRPIVGMRRQIAERMHRAKMTAAHFTFVEECDASRLVELRQQLLPEAERQGVRLTFLPFIIQAVTEALRTHPILNSAVDERTNELVYKRYYNIGVATATDAGLMVPVVQHAERLRLFELAREIERLSSSAQDGTLSPEDLRNSTFTVTSLGKQGGLLATPILNHPEVGILGVHRIKERPVVRDGEIVIGKVMLLSLSLDHRIVDGHVGAAFAYDVIETLENPERLVYEDL